MQDLPENDRARAPSRRRLRSFLLVLPAVAFVALLAYGLKQAGPSAIAPGRPGPEFDLPTLDGETLSSDELEGHPVVVNFWASWCGPCREEAPVLERVWRRYRDEGVIFLGVNLRDAESDARAFVEEFDITYPIVRDVDLDLERAFALTGLPETFFLDHRWEFVGSLSGGRESREQGTVILGAVSEEALVDQVEILLRRARSASSAAEGGGAAFAAENGRWPRHRDSRRGPPR